jgi:glutaredoxin
MKVKIFGKKDCPICKASLRKFEFFLHKWELAERVELAFYDLDTVDGLTEGSLLDALEVPTIVLEDEGVEIARWEKRIPRSDELGEIFISKA